MKRTALAALALGILSEPSAMARVDRVEIQAREPFHTSRVGTYVQIRGTFVGSLDPAEAR